MKNLFIIAITAVLFAASAGAQISAPDTLWTRRYRAGYQAYGCDVRQTSDGGFILVGETTLYGRLLSDVYLVKTDINGDIIWTRVFGGLDSDKAYSLDITQDNGFILVGSTWSYGAGRGDIFLIKTDANGDTLWTRTLGGVENDVGYCVRQTDDDGYIITGYTRTLSPSACYLILIKTSPDGDTLWHYTDVAGTGGKSVRQTRASGYIVTGTYTYQSTGDLDVYLIKANAIGDTAWTKKIGGSRNDAGTCVEQTPEGGYIITGATKSYGRGLYDVFLIKTDENGDTLWTKTYGGIYDDIGESVAQTQDGGYIIAGWTESFVAGHKDYYLIKTDSAGDTVWTKTLGGSGIDWGRSVQQTSDGGYILVGDSYLPGSPYSDAWLIRLAAETGVGRPPAKPVFTFTLHPPYPNPFNRRAVVRFEMRAASFVRLDVYDVWGRAVENLVSGFLPAGEHRVWLDGKNLASGLYFIQLQAGDIKQTNKIVLIK